MRLTDEQKAILEALREARILKINAFAGTGKTSTLKALAEHYPERNFIYLAFNRSVKEEARRKFPGNTRIFTTHGFALYNLRRRGFLPRNVKLRGNWRDVEVANFLGLVGESRLRLAYAVNALFENFLQSDALDLETYAKEHGVPGDDSLDPSYVAALAKRLWDLTFELGEMPHDFYLKVFHLDVQHFAPLYRGTVVLLDEAQDTNPVTLAIVRALAEAGASVVVVGDAHQQIYAFRGAVNAMERFPAERTLYLTRSFRLSPMTARMATLVLQLLKGEEKSIVGVGPSQNVVGEVVLTRTNSRAIEIWYRRRDERPVSFVRHPDAIFSLPLSVFHFLEGRFHLVRERWLLEFKDGRELKDYAEERQSMGDSELALAVKLAEEYDVELLYNLALVDFRVAPNTSNLLHVSTAHSAKGLEWETVSISDDFANLLEIAASYAISAKLAPDFPEREVVPPPPKYFYYVRKHEEETQTGNEALDFWKTVSKVWNRFLEEFKKRRKIGDRAALDLDNEINLFYVALTRGADDPVDFSENVESLAAFLLLLNREKSLQKP